MARALEGDLEDLELAEVIRVVALSRRSGTLALSSRQRTAELRFELGRVVSVRHSSESDTLGDVLVAEEVLTPRTVAQAGKETLDDVLRKEAARANDPTVFARAEQAIGARLLDVVARLLDENEGTFVFQTAVTSPDSARFLGDTALAVQDGVSGDQLVKSARQRRAPSLRDPRRARTEPPRALDDDAQEIVVAADEPSVLHALAREARAQGLDVVLASGAREAIDALTEKGPTSSAVAVVDLVMPRSSGRGILGGIEVLRRAEELGLAGRCFLTHDAPHDDASAVARALGAPALLVRDADASLSALLNPVLTLLGRPLVVDRPIDLAAELMRETGETEWIATPDEQLDEGARNLEVLKSLLAQVSNPTFEDEIPLLLLRFAAAFFARGALFAHHPSSGQLVGVGGFGFSSRDPGRAIHAVSIPSSADTVFSRAIRERAGVRQPMFESEWNTRLLAGLGGPRPSEVYTAPLSSPRGLEAVLYADNATTGRPFPETMLLEIFVQQAGVALERSSLVRKVDELLRGRGEVRA